MPPVYDNDDGDDGDDGDDDDDADDDDGDEDDNDDDAHGVGTVAGGAGVPVTAVGVSASANW